MGAAACGAAFVAVAALVAHGVFHRFDQYAVFHWMRWLAPGHHAVLSVRGPLFPRVVHGSPLGTAVDLLTYPASVVPSALIVALAARMLGRERGLQLVCLWLAVNGVEVVFKVLVEPPPLYRIYAGAPVHIPGFDHSLPSGHTLRSLVVATALVWAWWRSAPIAFLWAAAMPFALVLLGDHTPMDVIAGVLAFAALYLTVTATRWTALFM